MREELTYLLRIVCSKSFDTADFRKWLRKNNFDYVFDIPSPAGWRAEAAGLTASDEWTKQAMVLDLQEFYKIPRKDLRKLCGRC